MRSQTSWILGILFIALTFNACGGEINVEQTAQEQKALAWTSLMTLTEAERAQIIKDGQGWLTRLYSQQDLELMKKVFPQWTTGKIDASAIHLKTMIGVDLDGKDLISVPFAGYEKMPEIGISLTPAQRAAVLKYGTVYIDITQSYSPQDLYMIKKTFPGWTSGGVWVTGKTLGDLVSVTSKTLGDLVSIDAPDVVGIDAPDVVGIDTWPTYTYIVAENDR